MIQCLGILIIVNSLIITGWLVHNGKPYSILLCFIAIVAGLALLISDRISEISVKGLGTIKAAVKQVKLDAEYIAEIRERIDAQSATIDLVAKQSLEAKKLSEELAQKNDIAEKKLKDIEEILRKATESSDEIQSITQFTMTVVAAQNDDRQAFDQLKVWADDKSYVLSSYAKKAWEKIFDEHAPAFYKSGFTIPWTEGVDPSKLNFLDLQNVYNETSSHLKPAILEYIWNRNDINKKDKMQFLLDVMQNDKNLQAVEYAGRFFSKGANLKIKPLAVEYFVEWWEKNKDSIK